MRRRETRFCFAGSNTALLTNAVEGSPILVSYADIRTRPRWWEETLRPALEEKRFPFAILDSGAFTVQSQGICIDVEEYAAFAAAHRHLFDVIVNLDSIAGDLEESRANLATLRAAGVPAIPVFHEGEPWAELETMLGDTDFIGLGFARIKGRLANSISDRRAWLADAFERIGGRARVHGFAMTRHAPEFPFYSVDSTTWISEFCGIARRTPGRCYTGPHGIGGELARRLAGWTRSELARLAVASYRVGRAGGGVAENVERDARGQARTLLRRFGAEIERALASIEADRLAAAA